MKEKIYKLIIGEEGKYYDRRDCLPDNDYIYIRALNYIDAEVKAINYMNENYFNVEYELHETDLTLEDVSEVI